MHLSSLSLQPRLLVWIRSREVSWKQYIGPWRMVSHECTIRNSCSYTFSAAGVPFHNALGTKTSVYVGCFTREYEQLLGRDGEMDLKYIATGTGTAMLSNRLSWFYDFRGPSLTIDTACSSSLNACHLACASLRSGESSMVFVSAYPRNA